MDLTSSPTKLLNAAVAAHYSQLANEHWQQLAISDAVDWYATVQEAFVSGLAPLLYNSLLQTPSSTIAPDLLDNLRNSYYETAAYNALAVHNLANVLRCLSAGGISVIMLKGAALLHSVYPDLALRPMVDLDLLIPYHSLGVAIDLLAEIGYRQRQPLPFNDESGLFWNELLLTNDNENITQLELHWQLLDNPYYSTRLSVPWLLERAIPCQVEDVNALILAPNDSILHLSSHNLHHHRGQFRRAAVDIAFVASQYGSIIDWDQLVSQAARINLVVAVTTTLDQARDNWYASIPNAALDKLHSNKVGIRERLFVASQRSEFLKLLRILFTVPGLSQKWRYFVGQLFPGDDYMIWRYGHAGSILRPTAYIKRFVSGLATLISEISGISKEKDKSEAS